MPPSNGGGIGRGRGFDIGPLKATSESSGAGADSQLFRAEVLAARRTQWLGTVLMAPRPSHRFFTLFALLVLSGVLGLIFFADYTRKVRINGWLVPHEGMVRVLAPRPGVLVGLNVTEGAEVRKGDRLVTLSDEVQSRTGATQEQITRLLAERRASLLGERRQLQQLLAQRQEALLERTSKQRAEQAQATQEVQLLQSRVAIAERAEAQYKQLQPLGLISEVQLQQLEGETLEHRARLAALERTGLALERDRADEEAALRDLPLEFDKEMARLERDIVQVEQEQAEAEARREIVLLAPVDGTATAIQAELGTTVRTDVPLLSIVPLNARLEAHLYSPSRTVGFVRPGQRVSLRYEAYPYQKYGHQQGVVTSVSRSSVSPAELPAQLAGLTGLTKAGGNAAPEPIYRITVSLASQTITADDRPLQPGMLLSADVALERRRLFEWTLEPLHALSSK